MSGEPVQRRWKVALVEAAIAGELAGAVDQDLIPDAAPILVDYAIPREIEALPDKVRDDVLGIVGHAVAFAVIEDGDDIAVDGAAVYGALSVL